MLNLCMSSDPLGSFVVALLSFLLSFDFVLILDLVLSLLLLSYIFFLLLSSFSSLLLLCSLLGAPRF